MLSAQFCPVLQLPLTLQTKSSTGLSVLCTGWNKVCKDTVTCTSICHSVENLEKGVQRHLNIYCICRAYKEEMLRCHKSIIFILQNHYAVFLFLHQYSKSDGLIDIY